MTHYSQLFSFGDQTYIDSGNLRLVSALHNSFNLCFMLVWKLVVVCAFYFPVIVHAAIFFRLVALYICDNR